VNLTNKKYHVFNKESTKEEVERIRKSFCEHSKLEDFKKKAYEFFS
jgi:hypothetical protein